MSGKWKSRGGDMGFHHLIPNTNADLIDLF